MNAAEIADRLLADLAPIDTDAAEALGTEPVSLMPALAPADFAARHEAYLRAERALAQPDDDPTAGVLAALFVATPLGAHHAPQRNMASSPARRKELVAQENSYQQGGIEHIVGGL